MTPATLALGVAVAGAGLLLRGWAAGHIVKNERLATSGPYAHTRNPLYFGSFLLAVGFGLAAHWALGLVVLAAYVAVYVPVMRRERTHVREAFPGAYDEWARHVPMFVPRLTPWRAPGADGVRFDPELYRRHREWQAALGFVALVGWLAWRVAARS